MPRIPPKHRNLEYRMAKGTIVYHNNGLNDIRSCIYTGNSNWLLYNNELTTPNKFCTRHMEETRPNMISNRNAWVTCYIQSNTDKIKLTKIPMYDKPFTVLENNTNIYLNKNPNTFDIQNRSLIKELEKNNMPKRRTKKEQDEILRDGKTLSEWTDIFYKKKRAVWNRSLKEKIIDPDDYSQVTFAVRPSKENTDCYEMRNETMMEFGDIIPWKDTTNSIPDRFKDSNGYVRPFGEIVYEYKPYKNSPYHSLTKSTYRKYRYIPQLFRFVETGHIITVEEAKKDQ